MFAILLKSEIIILATLIINTPPPPQTKKKKKKMLEGYIEVVSQSICFFTHPSVLHLHKPRIQTPLCSLHTTSVSLACEDVCSPICSIFLSALDLSNNWINFVGMNFLLNNNILDWTRLKTCVDNNLNVEKILTYIMYFMRFKTWCKKRKCWLSKGIVQNTEHAVG